MSTGEPHPAGPATAPGGCRVALFTGPHARAPLHLAGWARAQQAPVIARFRTLVEFARALKGAGWKLVVVDCGPGNPRLADVVEIYRRSGSAVPLVVVGEATPQLAATLAMLPACHTLDPGDATGLVRSVIARCPGMGAPPPAARPVARADVVAAAVALLDREALVERLRPPLAAGDAPAVLAVMAVTPPAEPGVLATAGLAALETVGASTGCLAVLGPERLAALLDPGPADPASSVQLAQRLRQQLLRQATARAAGGAASAAVALSPARASDPDAEHWLERAERACGEVAAPSEHGYAVLSRVPVTTPSDRTLPALIQEALAGDRLSLAFQPIVSLRGDAREHYETLLRLPTVAAGEMLPGDFFAAAEGAGLMPAIDQWVVRAAVRRLALERGRRAARAHFFIPFSVGGLRDERVVVALCDELAQAGARGDWLTVQLRAGDARRYRTEAGRLVASLRKIRCRVALDRYEHDVTAQELVADLRFDFVKLAPALTAGVADSQDRLDALREAVRWLAAQDARSVATAVEDAHALAYLWTAGIDYAQGFFLQEPTADIAYDAAG